MRRLFKINFPRRRLGLACLLVLAVSLLGSVGLILAATPIHELKWQDNRVDAQIESWPLPRLLREIAEITKWQVYLEPDTQLTVSAKFSNLPPPEALSRLLAGLNFALLPQTNAPSKLFIFRTSVQEATEEIQPVSTAKVARQAGKPVPNELIVSLKPGSRLNMEDLARRLGAKITGRLEGTQLYRLAFEDETSASAALALLENEEDISSVDANYALAPPTRTEPLSFSSPLPLNLKPRIQVVGDPNYLIIGLIDTAVQAREANIKDFVLEGVSVVSEGSLTSSSPLHGTSMAETILHGVSLAPQPEDGTPIRIQPVDVYGRNATTTTFDVALGIQAAIKKGATIINLSLGSPGNSQFLHQVIQEAQRQGVLFVAAAGNEPTTAPTYPAAYPEVLATTAGDRKGNIAAYANRGDFVDVAAPGGNIVSFNNQSFLVSGTSTATAYVSGLSGGLAVSSGKPLNEVEKEIRSQWGAKKAPSHQTRP